ncbi:MgtC/SapB family protein [Rhodobacterales bacterium HKCCE3408]|nr:MgtC/SapB family protein [Rhodobacterales bacterium HKCCE3408]
MIEDILRDATGFATVPPAVAAARLIAAALIAAVIGLEREWRAKPAGLRTHMLVSVAACLFVILGQEISQIDFGTPDQQRNDPLRLIEAVTAGVAFLAAGLIFNRDGKVQNVTTGASLWLAGAIGLGCGAGQMLLAGMAAIIVVVVLFFIQFFEKPRDRQE